MDVRFLTVVLATILLESSVVYGGLMDWSAWGTWSGCTRTCATGARQRYRKCQELSKASQSYYATLYGTSKKLMSNCIGKYREYSICNKQPCSRRSRDFRSIQCERYNSRPLRNGKKYRWVPFHKAPNKCSLACRAVGQRFYAVLASKVIDGTECGLDRMCVAGVCQVIGCDGVIGSPLKLDKCGKCGGDNKSCKLVEGIYANKDLRFGYNKIAEIPAGACNVNVTELANSKTFLALKTSRGQSIINGNWAIDWEGDYKGGGTTFTYHRDRHRHVHPSLGESITSPGPLNETVHLYILYRRLNPGIKYQYTIPLKDHGSGSKSPSGYVAGRPDTQSITVQKPPKYVSSERSQSVAAFGDTGDQRSRSSSSRSSSSRSSSSRSSSSGRGSTTYDRRSRLQQLYDRYRNKQVSPSTFSGNYRRRQQQTFTGTGTANRQRDQIAINLSNRNRNNAINQQYSGSQYTWRISGFTDCSATCGGGMQNTVVVCVKDNSQAVVTNENCNNNIKPAVQSLRCNTNPCRPGWESSEWSKCSTSCGRGRQTRSVECKQKISTTAHISVTANLCRSKPRPSSNKLCENKPCTSWRVGKWSKCSTDCGKGEKTRTVECIDSKKAVLVDSLCKGSKPATKGVCRVNACKKVWLATSWSDQCSTDCGAGYYTRKVFCSADAPHHKGPSSCNIATRPKTDTPCNSDRPCGGKWFTGPWSKCTSCNGKQHRPVICMNSIGDRHAVVSNSHCIALEKPRTLQPCTTENCHAEWYMADWTPCSRTCNGGIRQRDIRCLDKDRLPSDTCNIIDKPGTKETCSTNPCPTEPPVSPNCKDRFTNCKLVVQARLCRYSYYKSACCKSCELHKLHHRKRHRHRK